MSDFIKKISKSKKITLDKLMIKVKFCISKESYFKLLIL